MTEMPATSPVRTGATHRSEAQSVWTRAWAIRLWRGSGSCPGAPDAEVEDMAP